MKYKLTIFSSLRSCRGGNFSSFFPEGPGVYKQRFVCLKRHRLSRALQGSSAPRESLVNDNKIRPGMITKRVIGAKASQLERIQVERLVGEIQHLLVCFFIIIIIHFSLIPSASCTALRMMAPRIESGVHLSISSSHSSNHPYTTENSFFSHHIYLKLCPCDH